MLYPVYVRGYEIKSNNIPLVFLFALVTDYYFQKEFFSSLQINSNSLKSTYLPIIYCVSTDTEPSGNSRVTIHKCAILILQQKSNGFYFPPALNE